MSTRGWQSKQIINPRGAWTSGALARVGNPSRASDARNVRFSPGLVTSREGTAAVFASSGRVGSMFNWISPSENHLIYLDGTAATRRKMSDGTLTTLASGVSARGLSCADLGPRLYFTGFTTANAGAMQCRIYDGASAIDTAFRGPLTVTSLSLADGGTGRCTKGTHKVGFIFQSRSGFSGQPSPVSGGVFSPSSITLNAQLRTITATLALDTPADAGTGSFVYPIMTRADNPDRWFFVPDVSAVLPASAPGTIQTFTISISDEDLALSATPADDQFNLLTQDGGGSGPFNPQFVAAYGKRMTYGVGNKIYVSEIDDAQAITEDFNVVQMPGQRLITTAAQLGQNYYMFGDRWTARVLDNGDLPSTWAAPATVSDSIGTSAPLGIEARTRGAYIWVASEAGAYRFDGSYPEHPISYFQSDIWARINWSAAYCIQVADDTTNLRVHFAVPLDGATSPSHDLVYDYTNGFAYDTCDFSLDNFADSTFSSIRAVKEAANNRTSMYIGPSIAGQVVKLSTATHDDVSRIGSSAPFQSVWESSYIRKPGEIEAKTIRVGNADLWIRGSGTLTHTWYGLDRILSVTPIVMQGGSVVGTLSAAPGIELQAKADLSPVENATFRFSVNGIGAWFALSGFKPYYRPSLWTR